MTLIFWISVLLIIYTYFAYPAGIWILANRVKLTPAEQPNQWPSITLLVPVYNDLEKALAKIENLSQLDYPKDKISIFIVSDGSTDNCGETLGKDNRITFISYPIRQGKPTALNTGIKQVTSEIIIFTDVRQHLKPDAAKLLVSRLLEPGIGAVSGELVLLDPKTNTGAHVSLYWQYEKLIRIAESKIASVAGVTGALYAIHTQDYTPLKPDTLIDDFEIPIQIIKNGQRCIMEPGAIIYDYPQENTDQEKNRKVRTLAGNFQSFQRLPWLFSPLQNPIWIQFISHKFLRLIMPYFLLLTLISSAAISGLFYNMAFLIQVIFYGIALLSTIFPSLKKNKIASLANVFTALNWAAVLAFKNHLSQKANVKWDKTS